MTKFSRGYGKIQLRRNLSTTLFSTPSQYCTPILSAHSFLEPMLILTFSIGIFNCYFHKNPVSLNPYRLVIYQEFIIIYIKLFRPSGLYNSTYTSSGIKTTPYLNFSGFRSIFEIIHNFISHMLVKNTHVPKF